MLLLLRRKLPKPGLAFQRLLLLRRRQVPMLRHPLTQMPLGIAPRRIRPHHRAPALHSAPPSGLALHSVPPSGPAPVPDLPVRAHAAQSAPAPAALPAPALRAAPGHAEHTQQRSLRQAGRRASPMRSGSGLERNYAYIKWSVDLSLSSPLESNSWSICCNAWALLSRIFRSFTVGEAATVC